MEECPTCGGQRRPHTHGKPRARIRRLASGVWRLERRNAKGDMVTQREGSLRDCVRGLR